MSLNSYDKIRKSQTEALSRLLDALMELDEAQETPLKELLGSVISDPNHTYRSLQVADKEVRIRTMSGQFTCCPDHMLLTIHSSDFN